MTEITFEVYGVTEDVILANAANIETAFFGRPATVRTVQASPLALNAAGGVVTWKADVRSIL